MKKVLLFNILCALSFCLAAQTIPKDRIVDWSRAGIEAEILSYSNVLDVTDYGLKGDGVSTNDAAFISAINVLNAKPGVLYFPSGTYLFNSSINLPDSVILRGSASESTFLKFNQNGSAANSINVHGTVESEIRIVKQSVLLNADEVIVDDAKGIKDGDYIKIYQNDSSLIVSSWAVHSVAQVIQVKEVNGNTLILKSPVRRDFLLSDFPRVVKINPRKGVGFECFSIERLDQTTDQTSNFDFDKAAQCWIVGVNSNKCNFAHVALSGSTNVLIRGNFFHHGFNYGGGGKAYGVCLQFSSGECLIENNVFNNLRHSMLFQCGANGNVCAYNYSLNPTRTEFPSNAGGDIVLHGDYPFANLFEGNVCQTISIDESHGANGPYNTFFRNNIQLYGIIISSATSGNNQNFVGNEIVNTGIYMGNYNLSGTGHFEYGNNHKGTIKPTSVSSLEDKSYYLGNRPLYYTSVYSWPSIGIPYLYNQPSLPSKERFIVSDFVDCSTEVLTSIIQYDKEERFSIYPNPTNGMVQFDLGENTLVEFCEIYNAQGMLLSKESLIGNKIDFSKYSDGIYLVKIGEELIKVIKK